MSPRQLPQLCAAQGLPATRSASSVTAYACSRAGNIDKTQARIAARENQLWANNAEGWAGFLGVESRPSGGGTSRKGNRRPRGAAGSGSETSATILDSNYDVRSSSTAALLSLPRDAVYLPAVPRVHQVGDLHTGVLERDDNNELKSLLARASSPARIPPKHIWQSIERPETATVEQAARTDPYKLGGYTKDHGYKLTANPTR